MNRHSISGALFYRKLQASLIIAFASGVQAYAQSPEPITASEILGAVRRGQAIRAETLIGELRNDITGDAFPFRLISNGEIIRYRFETSPPLVVQVYSDSENSQLEVSTNGNVEKLTPANVSTKILGTDLTYEELALRFIYWSNAKLVGEEKLKERKAWKIVVVPPNRRTQFSSVTVWIDQETSAPLRAEALDWSNRLVARFDVISSQKIKNTWYLKEMRIEGLEPASGKTITRTYLDIKSAGK